MCHMPNPRGRPANSRVSERLTRGCGRSWAGGPTPDRRPRPPSTMLLARGCASGRDRRLAGLPEGERRRADAFKLSLEREPGSRIRPCMARIATSISIATGWPRLSAVTRASPPGRGGPRRGVVGRSVFPWLFAVGSRRAAATGRGDEDRARLAQLARRIRASFTFAGARGVRVPLTAGMPGTTCRHLISGRSPTARSCCFLLLTQHPRQRRSVRRVSRADGRSCRDPASSSSTRA